MEVTVNINFDIYLKPSGGLFIMNNEPVTLETAKKLKRYGYPQGKSQMFYQKRKNCSVYDLIQNEGKHSALPSYDAPNIQEMMAYAKELSFASLFEPRHSGQTANEIINYLKAKK